MYPVSSLKQRKGRHALTVTGISLAIAMVVVMLSMGQGIETSTRNLFEGTGVDLYVTSAGYHPFFQDLGTLTDGRELSDAILDGNPDVKATSPRLLEVGFLLRVDPPGTGDEPRIVNSLVRGLIPERDEPFNIHEITRGRDLADRGDPFYSDPAYGSGNTSTWSDSRNFTGEIVLNEKLAELLDINVGGQVRLNTYLPEDLGYLDDWNASAVTFTTVGLYRSDLEGPGDTIATVHLSELQFVVGKDQVAYGKNVLMDQVNKIYVQVAEGADPDRVTDWIEGKLNWPEEVSAFTQEEFLQDIFDFYQQFRAYATIIAIVTIAVVLLFISTVLSISVRQRQTEIGILRAIGFSRGSVIKLMLAESLVLCLLGFSIGMVIGIVANHALDVWVAGSEFAQSLPAGIVLFQLTPMTILWVSGLALGIGVLSGLVPAITASQMDPATAIRRVG